MNRSDIEHNNASGTVDSNSANTRLTGSRLIVARTVWLVLVIPSLGLFIASLLVSYQQMLRVCVDPVTCNLSAGTPIQVQQSLATLGLSLSGFAALVTIFYVITAAIWYAVGFLIFWRRSDDWLALLAAFFLVMFNVTSSGNTVNALSFAYPILVLPLSLVNFLGQVSLLVFFLLFPNGRLVPRWMGLILLLAILEQFFTIFPSVTANWPAWLGWLGPLVVYGAIISSQIYRYRRVSTPVQRQQTKWIILGLVVAIGVVIGVLAIGVFIPNIAFSNNLGAGILFTTIWPAALLLIPLSIGFSILRYRLYDIDLLINRTLVYGTLTVLLALVYFGLIFALQYLLRGIISQNNDVAIVVSTLAIAALFQPLRHRIQAIIDRRFYRRKYDAAKIVETFSATLRNEVDLNQLSEHLIAVVQDTMQPAHVSLWLRKSDHERKSDTQVE
ncbi:MAG TPA: hypothetical protein VIX20_12095 [Ktedonobacteraceae bacterium]